MCPTWNRCTTAKSSGIAANAARRTSRSATWSNTWCKLRDEKGMSTEDIINGHVFLTAGGCGPCRFGMYVTEYRKALRDAGFDGFRVLTFQMAGGIQPGHRQGTGTQDRPRVSRGRWFAPSSPATC